MFEKNVLVTDVQHGAKTARVFWEVSNDAVKLFKTWKCPLKIVFASML